MKPNIINYNNVMLYATLKTAFDDKSKRVTTLKMQVNIFNT